MLIIRIFTRYIKWDISKVTDISSMFNKCSSLKMIPDISNWCTHNIRNMKDIFNGCLSLKSLPDISKWDKYNINDKDNNNI